MLMGLFVMLYTWNGYRIQCFSKSQMENDGHVRTTQIWTKLAPKTVSRFLKLINRWIQQPDMSSYLSWTHTPATIKFRFTILTRSILALSPIWNFIATRWCCLVSETLEQLIRGSWTECLQTRSGRLWRCTWMICLWNPSYPTTTSVIWRLCSTSSDSTEWSLIH